MEAAFDWVTAFADQGFALFWLLFALAFANVFAPPVPIETISIFVGYLTGVGYGNPVLLWLALSAGMAAGSSVLYYLARSQEQRLLNNRLVRKQVTPAHLEKVEGWFNRWGLWTIYAGKLIPGMSFATVLASGLFGVSPRKALTAIYAANLIYFAVSIMLGRILGERWHLVIELAKEFWPWALVLLVIAGALVYYNFQRRKARC